MDTVQPRISRGGFGLSGSAQSIGLDATINVRASYNGSVTLHFSSLETYLGILWDDGGSASRTDHADAVQCCGNAPIHGACADAAMQALILMDTALVEVGINGGPAIFNHDEIVRGTH